MGIFAATHQVVWNSQILELWVVNFFRRPHRRVECDCLLILHSPRQHLSPTVIFPKEVKIFQARQLIDTGFHLLCSISFLPCWLSVTGIWAKRLSKNSCPRDKYKLPLSIFTWCCNLRTIFLYGLWNHFFPRKEAQYFVDGIVQKQ